MTDLFELAQAARPTVSVIGLGGAGCNITTWLTEKRVTGGKVIAANTDAVHLVTCKADKLLLLGKDLCKGQGCGGFSELGARAAIESLADLKKELEGTSLVFILAGLGGGTGTGAAPVVAELTRELGALTIACVTLPFEIELLRRAKAMEGISALAKKCDSVVIIDNTKLREVAGNLPLKEAFAVANALIGAFVKNITETTTQPSLVNLDYADLKAVTERGGISAIGIGEGEGDRRVEKAITNAMSAQLLDIPDISTTYGLLIHILGGADLTLEEVARIGETVMSKVPNTKRVVWGARIDGTMTGRIRVMVVLAGVESPQILEAHD
jgi:cell division protein FtsZ